MQIKYSHNLNWSPIKHECEWFYMVVVVVVVCVCVCVCVWGGGGGGYTEYTGFTLSVRPSICPSVDDNMVSGGA